MKIRTWSSLIISLLLLGGLWSKALGQSTLGYFSTSYNAGYRTNFSALYVSFGFSDTNGSHTIFGSIPLTPSNVGQVFPVTQNDDPQFSTLVALLTNGAPETFSVTETSPSWPGGTRMGSEAALFSLPTGTDFHGFIIDNIALQLVSMTVTNDGTGFWRCWSSYKILINGEAVPKPIVLASASTAGGNFSFDIAGPTKATIVIEACTNLANPAWIPVATNVLSYGTNHFSDAHLTNYPYRFYRASEPQTLNP